MGKRMTTAAVAASMLGGMAIGSFVAPPMTAFASDSSTPEVAVETARTPGQWVTDALRGLVDKGTITKDQSDAVAKALQDARPKGVPHVAHMVRPDVEVAAKVLGMNNDDLREAMRDKSLADIAKGKNVDVQKVIDALVESEIAHIDELVKDGAVPEAHADQLKERVQERVTHMVNNVRPGIGAGFVHKRLSPPAGLPAI